MLFALQVVLMLGQPIAIAVVAQKLFGKTGAVWFLITLALNSVLWEWMHRTSPPVDDNGTFAIVFLSAAFSTVILLVVLWTLPKRRA